MEIRVVAGPAGVEALLLTPDESSRQTLTTAMDEVAARLKVKGIAFRGTVRPRSRAEDALDRR